MPVPQCRKAPPSRTLPVGDDIIGSGGTTYAMQARPAGLQRLQLGHHRRQVCCVSIPLGPVQRMGRNQRVSCSEERDCQGSTHPNAAMHQSSLSLAHSLGLGGTLRIAARLRSRQRRLLLPPLHVLRLAPLQLPHLSGCGSSMQSHQLSDVRSSGCKGYSVCSLMQDCQRSQAGMADTHLLAPVFELLVPVAAHLQGQRGIARGSAWAQAGGLLHASRLMGLCSPACNKATTPPASPQPPHLVVHHDHTTQHALRILLGRPHLVYLHSWRVAASAWPGKRTANLCGQHVTSIHGSAGRRMRSPNQRAPAWPAWSGRQTRPP